MSYPETVDEENENTRMNWFAAFVLIAGSPLFVLAFMNHHWAEIALKIYIITACVFGSIILFIERKYLKERWLWIGMIPLIVLHSGAMYGLVIFNEKFPQIDHFPMATYGLIVPIAALETGLLCLILERFRP